MITNKTHGYRRNLHFCGEPDDDNTDECVEELALGAPAESGLLPGGFPSPTDEEEYDFPSTPEPNH